MEKLLWEPKECALVRNSLLTQVEMKTTYAHLTIPKLKALLRSRGASLKGRKADLVNRLICYDENFNFNAKVPNDMLFDSNNNMSRLLLPDNTHYKDLNASSQVPKLLKENMHHYLERFSARLDSGQSLYDNSFLLSLRWATDSNVCAFQGCCAAMMYKHVRYIADVLIADDGSIVGCQCECAAGEGPNAHCKHVIAVMCALVHLQTEGVLNLRKTCTQKLQAFHRPSKEYCGTPIKTESLPRGSYNHPTKVNFNPIDPESIDRVKYNRRIRNLTIGFCASNKSTMPFMHLYKPANLYATNNDHDYAGNPEYFMLQHLKLRNVSDQDVAEIESATRQQARSKFWNEVRSTHLTSSNFHSISKVVSEEAKINLAMRLMNPNPFTNKAVQHGKDCEPKAIQKFESFIAGGGTTKECGFFISKEHPFLGSSPDRLLPLSVVEVKCPYNQRQSLISHETVPFLTLNNSGELALKEDHEYYYQIQGQMFVVGKPYATLVVYTFKDFKVIDVPRDDHFITQMVSDLEDYYNCYFKKLLLEKYLYKNYGACFFK